jgi:hypothetical protein
MKGKEGGTMEGQIFGLIGKAMEDIGAIGKDSVNKQQGFKYRGIDAVMNAMNPVMRKYGLFLTPEVLDHKREERQTSSGGRLIYSILTMRYTMYAPDGSSVSAVVIGEGMDSGDKASNKAMSVAMKYAMFQLFCIPTEEMVDPDSETPPESKPLPADALKPGEKMNLPPAGSWNPKNAIGLFCKRVGLKLADFANLRAALIAGGIVKDIPSGELSPVDFDVLCKAMEANYPEMVKVSA